MTAATDDPLPRSHASFRRFLLCAPLLVMLAACGPATLPPGDAITDPSEAQNRAVHRGNVALDRALIGPTADAYGRAIPDPVRTGISNVAANLGEPSNVLNNLLQLRLGQAVENTLRFAVNSTIGLAGLLDPASAIGLPEQDTNFGETMHVWGVPEGAYTYLPVVGPSTSRDTVGLIVDIATNPVRIFLPAPESSYATGAGILSRINDRHEFDNTIDSIYDDSADSYAQLRSLYIQNRRFQLRGDDEVDYFDPYGDLPTGVAADPLNDPYFDPYEDPYVQ